MTTFGLRAPKFGEGVQTWGKTVPTGVLQLARKLSETRLQTH
jgi:hypothetical protein